jgi:hypothetical protein
VTVTIPRLYEHVPDQPAWTCSSCGNDWPCDPAREHLTEEYQDEPVALAIYMGAHLGLAAFEIKNTVTLLELFQRFVAWTKPQPLDAGGGTVPPGPTGRTG